MAYSLFLSISYLWKGLKHSALSSPVVCPMWVLLPAQKGEGPGVSLRVGAPGREVPEAGRGQSVPAKAGSAPALAQSEAAPECGSSCRFWPHGPGGCSSLGLYGIRMGCSVQRSLAFPWVQAHPKQSFTSDAKKVLSSSGCKEIQL